MAYDVVIVGAGPAGIFAALELAKQQVKVLMIEKGKDIDQRVCISRTQKKDCMNCKPCSIVCGWGGAGAYSDGKLTLSPEVGGHMEQYIGKEKLIECIDYVDQQYVYFGGPQKIYGLQNPDAIHRFQQKALQAELKLIPVGIRHLGTGRCQEILKKMKMHLLDLGVEIITCTEVDDILVDQDRVVGVRVADRELHGHCVIIAPGREGSQWLTELATKWGLQREINPVDIGVRIEVPATIMEPLTKLFYEAKLIYYAKSFDDKVRTFCMNPYGEVVLENNDGVVTVNGHSHAYQKTDNTNFAILVSKTFTEPFKDPIAYGKYIASLANLLGGGVIVQRLGDLLAGQRTNEHRLSKSLTIPTLSEATPGDLSLVLPYRHMMAIVEMLKALNDIVPGIYGRYTLLYGVEVKFYSSRLQVSKNLETSIRNLYVAGDCLLYTSRCV